MTRGDRDEHIWDDMEKKYGNIWKYIYIYMEIYMDMMDEYFGMK